MVIKLENKDFTKEGLDKRQKGTLKNLKNTQKITGNPIYKKFVTNFLSPG